MKELSAVFLLGGIILAASILGFSQKIETKDGGLLDELPIEHFVSAIRIFKDNLFLIDVDRRAKIYHYKIIEK